MMEKESAHFGDGLFTRGRIIPLGYATRGMRAHQRIRPRFFLMFAAAICLVGGTIIIPRFVPRDGPLKIPMAMGQIAGLAGALQQFRADIGRYPSTDEGLAALVAPPQGIHGWRGPYVDHLTNDPWGNPYVYHHDDPFDLTGERFELFSCGPDGKEGTRDDIRLR